MTENENSRNYTFFANEWYWCRFTALTYIIRLYNPSIRITDLVSHTAYIVCVSFIHRLWYLQFKAVSERQIFFEKFFMGILFILWVFATNLVWGNRWRNTFCFLFWCLAWGQCDHFSIFAARFSIFYFDLAANLQFIIWHFIISLAFAQL